MYTHVLRMKSANVITYTRIIIRVYMGINSSIDCNLHELSTVMRPADVMLMRTFPAAEHKNAAGSLLDLPPPAYPGSVARVAPRGIAMLMLAQPAVQIKPLAGKGLARPGRPPALRDVGAGAGAGESAPSILAPALLLTAPLPPSVIPCTQSYGY